MNNDADSIFTAVWQQMIGFSNMSNLFDCDGGTYSYLEFKKWSLSNFWVVKFNSQETLREGAYPRTMSAYIKIQILRYIK